VEYADGFGLARASNTTPVIVIRFEAESGAALERIKGEFRRALQPLKPGAPLPY
jgi:phosphomannomutase/phosphoglucomutase